MQEKEYTWCFACGKDNPIGLKMEFTMDAEECLISVLLDEIMGHYLFVTEGKPAYTAKMELRYRQPVMIGETVKCVGRRLKQKGRLVEMQGQIITKDGIVAAEAVAKMMLEENNASEKQ